MASLEPGAPVLLSCVIFGNGLHLEILGGRNDQQVSKNSLLRQKREWIVPPAVIWEERDNFKKNPIARIRSDREGEPGLVITYTISGQGVTEPPYQLFVINGKTGDLNITGIVDREQTPMLHLKGYALDQNGANLEKPLDLRIKVLDVNDNSPVFSQEVFSGSVEELSTIGTVVMKITATDADEPGTLNSQIAYRIVSQQPDQPPAFIINKATGEVRTAVFQLDREAQSSYTLIVEAKDQDGKENGHGQQTTLQIKILDVNDNVPVLEKDTYEGSVKENTANVEIMRLKAFDRDEEFSDNWLAQFTILSGNEGGYFHIETDQQTNEGILTLVKEINYEDLKSADLNIVVANKAAYHQSIINQGFQAKSIPIKINVENVREGPVFKPQTLVIKGNEKMTVNQIIGSFQAYDEDTGRIAENVRYAKDKDVANWFIIDSKTSEIKLIKVPDYESPFVFNGTYTATILAISNDIPSQTATGTIVIEVQDFNDHCPTLVTRETTVCTDTKFINVTAEDRDTHPNGGPFTFTIIDDSERMSYRWIIGQVDGTRAQLVPQNVNPGTYEVPLLVKDNQGLSCPEPQILKVQVCDCVDGAGCQEAIVGSSVVLGPSAIALIILALLLLLLVPLLLLACGFGSGTGKGFVAIPDTSEEMLRNWNSEGAAPEDKAILSLGAPPALDNSASNMGLVATGVGAGATGAGAAAGGGGGGGGGSSSVFRDQYISREEQTALLSGADYRGMRLGGTSATAAGGGMTATGSLAAGGTMTLGAGRTIAMESGGTVNEDFLRSYFSEKADAFADEDETQLAKDCLLVYSQDEEKDSARGSVGCCSFIEDDFDEHFLDDLGDKFKTLAEICMGKHVGMGVGQLSSQVPKNASPSLTVNESDSQYLHQQNVVSSEQTYASGPSYQLSKPTERFGSGTVTEETVTETKFTSNLKQARPIPDPIISSSNVVVTETSYGARPPTVILDPQFTENVVVTERVLAPASSLQNVLDMPPGAFPDLPDSKYVVVRERERVLVPSSDLKAPLSNLSEGQNVVVTETLMTPSSGRQSTTEPTTYSDTERQEHVFISEPFLNQTNAQEVLSSGSTLSKSSTFKKYSSVQYTRS
ncbi:desmoglein-2 [Sceloporus undulatus]|uniref:desmoglein-2 n=1 Tax=Sceloporus undulatus TaxID=8520 RepID=UPI001C4C2524|nr:desmoglein-2 [Sceloporus undulatus]